jgi:allantoin racemase
VRIAVVLPSSAMELLADRRLAYARYAGHGTEIAAHALHERVPRDADPSDDFLMPEILEQVIAAERSGADAAIVDCMEDPAVEEARRLVRIPVIGPGHAAMSLAALLSYRFSILYPLPQLRLMERLVLRHGLAPRVASIRQLSCGLDTIHNDPEGTLECMVDAAIGAVRQDGAHAIVPACTLTSALTQQLMSRLRQERYPVPVVDGPGAAVKMAESLVGLGLVASPITYPPPLGISRPIR